ncbi:hypothetical protein RCL1_009126 [Eukaryota sp. TZLM3-RCL]
MPTEASRDPDLRVYASQTYRERFRSLLESLPQFKETAYLDYKITVPTCLDFALFICGLHNTLHHFPSVSYPDRMASFLFIHVKDPDPKKHYSRYPNNPRPQDLPSLLLHNFSTCQVSPTESMFLESTKLLQGRNHELKLHYVCPLNLSSTVIDGKSTQAVLCVEIVRGDVPLAVRHDNVNTVRYYRKDDETSDDFGDVFNELVNQSFSIRLPRDDNEAPCLTLEDRLLLSQHSGTFVLILIPYTVANYELFSSLLSSAKNLLLSKICILFIGNSPLGNDFVHKDQCYSDTCDLRQSTHLFLFQKNNLTKKLCRLFKSVDFPLLVLSFYKTNKCSVNKSCTDAKLNFPSNLEFVDNLESVSVEKLFDIICDFLGERSLSISSDFCFVNRVLRTPIFETEDFVQTKVLSFLRGGPLSYRDLVLLQIHRIKIPEHPLVQSIYKKITQFCGEQLLLAVSQDVGAGTTTALLQVLHRLVSEHSKYLCFTYSCCTPPPLTFSNFFKSVLPFASSVKKTLVLLVDHLSDVEVLLSPMKTIVPGQKVIIIATSRLSSSNKFFSSNKASTAVAPFNYEASCFSQQSLTSPFVSKVVSFMQKFIDSAPHEHSHHQRGFFAIGTLNFLGNYEKIRDSLVYYVDRITSLEKLLDLSFLSTISSLVHCVPHVHIEISSNLFKDQSLSEPDILKQFFCFCSTPNEFYFMLPVVADMLINILQISDAENCVYNFLTFINNFHHKLGSPAVFIREMLKPFFLYGRRINVGTDVMNDAGMRFLENVLSEENKYVMDSDVSRTVLNLAKYLRLVANKDFLETLTNVNHPKSENSTTLSSEIGDLWRYRLEHIVASNLDVDDSFEMSIRYYKYSLYFDSSNSYAALGYIKCCISAGRHIDWDWLVKYLSCLLSPDPKSQVHSVAKTVDVLHKLLDDNLIGEDRSADNSSNSFSFFKLLCQYLRTDADIDLSSIVVTNMKTLSQWSNIPLFLRIFFLLTSVAIDLHLSSQDTSSNNKSINLRDAIRRSYFELAQFASDHYSVVKFMLFLKLLSKVLDGSTPNIISLRTEELNTFQTNTDLQYKSGTVLSVYWSLYYDLSNGFLFCWDDNGENADDVESFIFTKDNCTASVMELIKRFVSLSPEIYGFNLFFSQWEIGYLEED